MSGHPAVYMFLQSDIPSPLHNRHRCQSLCLYSFPLDGGGEGGGIGFHPSSTLQQAWHQPLSSPWQFLQNVLWGFDRLYPPYPPPFLKGGGGGVGTWWGPVFYYRPRGGFLGCFGGGF